VVAAGNCIIAIELLPLKIEKVYYLTSTRCIEVRPNLKNGKEGVLTAPEKNDWKEITPAPLQPAIQHLQETFDTAAWQVSQITQHLAFASLHVAAQKIGDPYLQPFAKLRALLPKDALEEFDSMVALGTEPALFRSYFNLYRRGLEHVVGNHFDEVLKVATANRGLITKALPEWASLQLEPLVHDQKHCVETWIMDVCDAHYSHTKWRAPLFIHMQPSGNTFYIKDSAWNREDEARTLHLRSALANDFVLFLDIYLEKITGQAHLEIAQGSLRTNVSMPAISRMVSQAPRPITPVRGGSYQPPKPTEPMVEYPPSFPRHLIPRTNLIIDEGLQKFPIKKNGLELSEFVINKLIPLIVSDMETRQRDAATALEWVAEFVRWFLVSNSENRHDFDQRLISIRKSAAWIELSKALAEQQEARQPSSASMAAAQEQPSHENSESDALQWREIKILFTSDERVQIWQNSKSETLNYAEFGFADKRNGMPNKAWGLLRIFALKNGIVDTSGPEFESWSRIEKSVQSIRSLLRKKFGLTSDPIPFVSKGGYQTRFKIGCAPSFKT
jgi:hypothetical protein